MTRAPLKTNKTPASRAGRFFVTARMPLVPNWFLGPPTVETREGDGNDLLGHNAEGRVVWNDHDEAGAGVLPTGFEPVSPP